MKILISGVAGFIGFHLAYSLNKIPNFYVIGIDNLDSYYDVNLKKDRLSILKKNSKKFIFYKSNICNKNKLSKIFKENKVDIVINLAAQAGVRYSIENPKKYFNTNLLGFFNILDVSIKYNIKH